uniref:Uncharacterized protein n=1 Tax=Panagrolaimus davidi TaxID=227884 RepID=A0A914QWU5_9BILA
MSIFDDLVGSGAFSNNLYATSRLLERSRSRTRERRRAMRSARSASQYSRYASYNPAPIRSREYSTPPTREVSRPPARSGSFASFLDYSNSKQYELARNPSRGSLYGSYQNLSRYDSRGDLSYFYGAGRIGGIDSYVKNMNQPYEWQMPATYSLYRSTSRPNVGYAPLNGLNTYSNAYVDSEVSRRARQSATPSQVRSLYEDQIVGLQRSLSRERYNYDRLRSQYTSVTHQLESACKQADLMRTGSYSSWRSGSEPRTSVFTHFYPYY